MSEEPRVLGVPALDDHVALLNFTEALGIAVTAAKQLAYYREDPRWLTVHHQLGMMRSIASQLAIRR